MKKLTLITALLLLCVPFADSAPQQLVKQKQSAALLQTPSKVLKKAAAVDAFTVPFILAPTADDFARFTIVNANGDNKTWQNEQETSMRYSYNSTVDADDWAFIPVQISGNGIFAKLQYELKAQYQDYPESLEIGFGTMPDAIAMTIVKDHATVSNTSFEKVETLFPIDISGVCYIGFHAKSKKDRGHLYVRNISLEAVTDLIPLACELVESSIDGFNYTATIEMPTSTLQGQTIAGNVGLKVDIDGKETKTYTYTPGQTISVELTLDPGKHVLTYTTYLINGEKTTYGDSIQDEVIAVNTDPQPLPFNMALNGSDLSGPCIVYDANNDDVTWEYSIEDQAAQYYYSDIKADDWIFLPLIDFGQGGAFDVKIEARVRGSRYPESFEICAGPSTSPVGMVSMMAFNNIDNEYYQEYTGKITLTQGGNYVVGIHATSEADAYSLFVRNISITGAEAGGQIPGVAEIQSANFNGLSGTLDVKLPALSTDAMPLTEAVALKVDVDGVEYTRTAAAAAGSVVSVPMTLTLGRHTISVTPFIGEGETIKYGSSSTTEVTIQNPEEFVYSLPFFMQPTLGEFEQLKIDNANEDTDTWTYNANAGVMVCRTTNNNAADDWVYFPPFAIEDIDRVYNISADVRAYLEQYPEDFEIYICKGNSPDQMVKTPLIEEKNMSVYLYKTFTARYIAPEAGNYFIAIHRSSNGEAHTLSVKNIKAEDAGMSANAPAQCINLQATPDPTGAAKATVTFEMPLVSVRGTALPSDVEISATVTSVSGDAKTVTGLPGSSQEATINTVDGTSTITVQTLSTTEGLGDTTEISVRCGIDSPSAPEVTMTVGEDNLSATITWTDSNIGVNGGPVNTSALSHAVYIYLGNSGEYWTKVADIPVGQTSYTYNAEAQLLDSNIIGVIAINDKGESDLGMAMTLGAPYTIPLDEDFASGRYQPVMIDTPTEEYSDNWALGDPGQIYPALEGQGITAIVCHEIEDNGRKYAQLTLPKFSTEHSKSVKVTLNLFTSPLMPRVELYASSYAQEMTYIGEIPAKGEEGWDNYEFVLPESFIGKKWVEWYVRLAFDKAPEMFIFKGYQIKNVYQKQLSTSIRATEPVVVGEPYTFTATVRNESEVETPLPQMLCTLTVGDTPQVIEPVATPNANTVALAPNGVLTMEYSFTPTAEMLGNRTLKFELTGFDDEVAEDNVATRTIEITTGGHPIVTDLAGTRANDGGLQLTWTAPKLEELGFDDVESYEAFTFDENIGQWLNIDGDKKLPYAIGNTTFPGYNMARGFQVFNNIGLNIMPAFSGSQCFMTVTPEDGSKADDWLISPEVIGGTTVSFRLNVLSSEYGAEQVDVLYSTTDRNRDSFTLLQTFTQTQVAWNPLEVTLPSDAKYFAFHYRCADIFGICLDDIQYTPITNAEISGYNVYRNDVKIAEGQAATGYIVRGAQVGDRYNVTVLTDVNGKTMEHPFSNTYISEYASGVTSVESVNGTIEGKNGYILVNGFEDITVTVYTPDGIIQYSSKLQSQSEKINLNAGVYIVQADNTKPVKVVVK